MKRIARALKTVQSSSNHKHGGTRFLTSGGGSISKAPFPTDSSDSNSSEGECRAILAVRDPLDWLVSRYLAAVESIKASESIAEGGERPKEKLRKGLTPAEVRAQGSAGCLEGS